MTHLIRKLSGLTLLLAATAFPPAYSHDAWPIRQNDDSYKVVYGHQGKLEPYTAEKVKKIQAFDKSGQSLTVARSQTPEGEIGFSPKGNPAMLTLEFDNGYWTKTTHGSVNLPKNKAEGALSAAHLIKFSKTIIEFSPGNTTPTGQRLEIVPLASKEPSAGSALSVQVLWDGQPLDDAALVRDHGDSEPVHTDAQGRANLPTVKGHQVWFVTHKQAIQGDERADDYSASANLIFEIE